jgi:hypothetical protein
VSSATHMAHLSAENKRLKLELTAMREKDGVFMPLPLYAPSPLHVFAGVTGVCAVGMDVRG